LACIKKEFNVNENAPVGSIEFTASFDAETKTTLNNGKTEWGSRDIDIDEACPMDRTIAIGHGCVL
jgi:hypothetical protein